MGPSRRAASSSASLPGGRFAFLSHGRAVVKARQHGGLEGFLVLDAAHQGTRSRRGEAMGDQDRSRGSHHVDGRSAQAVPDEQRRAGQSRRHRVAVARRRRRWRCRPRCARPRWWPGTGPAGGRAAARCRPARRPWCVHRSGPGVRARHRCVAQKTSRERWASSGFVAAMVRHQRPETKRTEDSTAPLRLPRLGGQGSTTAP